MPSPTMPGDKGIKNYVSKQKPLETKEIFTSYTYVQQMHFTNY